MSNERQIIEETARDICNLTVSCEECVMLAHKTGQSKEQYCKAMRYAERAYNAGYRRQREGEWIKQVKVARQSSLKPLYYYQCNLCGVYLAKQANYCPNCGAKMKGGA